MKNGHRILIGVVGYLGATIRWLFLRRKYSFKQLYDEPSETNERTGFLIFVVTIVTWMIIHSINAANEERDKFVKRRIQSTIELVTVESDSLTNIYDRSLFRLRNNIKDSLIVRESFQYDAQKHSTEMSDLMNSVITLNRDKEILKEDFDAYERTITPILDRLSIKRKQLDSLAFKFGTTP